MAEVSSNRVAVLDSRLHRITYLTGDLEFEAFVGLPGSASNIVALDSGIVALMRLAQGNPAARLVTTPPLVHRMTESGDVLWSRYSDSFTMVERPYWPSLASHPVATAGDSIFVMTSLTYPATILSGAGEVVGVLGNPSASFRDIPVFEEGEFADYDSQRAEFADGGFDQVDRIDVVSDSHLVMTRRRQRGLVRRGSHDFSAVEDRQAALADRGRRRSLNGRATRRRATRKRATARAPGPRTRAGVTARPRPAALAPDVGSRTGRRPRARGTGVPSRHRREGGDLRRGPRLLRPEPGPSERPRPRRR